jgi:uncharacterized membrane protein YfcA
LIELLSTLINASGTLLSIAGAVYNAKGHHKFALVLWAVSNCILIVFFTGVALGWFVLNGGAWLQVGLYIVFCITSCYGYWRINKKENLK